MVIPWSDRVLIIAEIGNNHGGELAVAKRLVDEAAKAGADVAKFQSFVPDEMAIETLAKAAYQAAATDPSETQYQRLCRVRLSDDDHWALAAHCADRGVLFCSSAFDVSSARLLRAISIPFFKIPSGEITNLPLLSEIASYGTPILISTGMADLAEIERAIAACGGADPDRIALLHCVSAYPAAISDANLRAIEVLRKTFGVPAGFSDHTEGIEAAIAAVALGAVVVEKHITLDRSSSGGDHRASLEPGDFKRLVSAIRRMESALGDGVKRCLPAEQDVRAVARKSIVARRDIQAGEIIAAELLALKRPGTGLSPSCMEAIVGSRALRPIRANQQISAADFDGASHAGSVEARAADPVRLSAVISPPSRTIRGLMQSIDSTGLRGAFVCDDDHELQGIVMDADIRRALLANVNMEASVKTIMRTAVFAIADTLSPADQRRALLMSGKLLAPIVDGNRRVVDYLTINDVGREVLETSTRRGGIVAPQRVLVIGGAGYIGSMLVEKLLRRDYRVRVLDLLLYGKDPLRSFDRFPQQGNLEFIRGDCRDPEIIDSALEGVDAVVHLGEIVGDPACAINEAFTIDTNYAATHTIVERCVRKDVRRLVFMSSCSVYGHNDFEVSETSALQPVSLYARCKIESERAVLGNGGDRLDPTVLRLATVHGGSHRQRLDLVVNYLAVRAAASGRIQIFGGDQWRPFVSVRDVCRAIVDVLNADIARVGGQIFNVGDSRENYQMKGVGAAVKELVPGTTVEIVAEERDSRNYRVNFEKIRHALGFTAEYTVADSIRELTAAYGDGKILPDYNDPRYHNLLSLK
jgi:sialic acid synthase SpsE/nucleoside-diphosphate-sugar epimerase